MGTFDVVVKNYRCFSDQLPVRLTLAPGFTAFVGINNAGKSSLLRLFLELRPTFAHLAEPNSWIPALRGAGFTAKFHESVRDPAAVFFNGNARDLSIEIEPHGFDTPPGMEPLGRLTLNIPRHLNASLQYPLPPVQATIRMAEGYTVWSGEKPITVLSPFLELFKDLSESLYIGPFRNALDAEPRKRYFDIDTGRSFVTAWRDAKTGDDRTANTNAAILENDIRKIFGYETLQINPSATLDSLHLLIDGLPYRLDEVGSGLAQFILVLMNAAVKRPSYVLIDEPELSLHPSLQLDFLTTLAAYASKSVIYTTHSYGLARASADRIYSVRLLADRTRQVRSLEETPRLSEFVGELSFSGYRDLGFDKLLLVEGATDVKTTQQLLRLLKKEHQVVVIPLGGSAMINGDRVEELAELCRICDHVHVLIDSEKNSEESPLSKEREAFVAICASAGIRCHVLERRAIENYFPQSAITRGIRQQHQQLAPYEKLDKQWAKADNWRIARWVTVDDLANTDLLAALEDL